MGAELEAMATPESAGPTVESPWLVVGRVVAPQGLRGEVRVYPDTDFPERFTEPGPRWLRSTPGGSPQPLTLVSGRWLPHKGLYVVSFAEVQSREQAEALRQGEILVQRGDRPPLGPDEYHVDDLIGLGVRLGGATVGTVVDVYAAGNDLLAVALEGREDRPVLVPFVPAIVPVVNLGEGYVEITPPPGLLD